MDHGRWRRRGDQMYVEERGNDDKGTTEMEENEWTRRNGNRETDVPGGRTIDNGVESLACTHCRRARSLQVAATSLDSRRHLSIPGSKARWRDGVGGGRALDRPANGNDYAYKDRLEGQRKAGVSEE
ncbi:hypothetical protein AB1N83_014038 [Pleurotus pulmonarius]